MRYILIILFIFLLGFGGFLFFKQPKKSSPSILKNGAKTQAVQKASPKETYIFVPYWTIDQDIKSTPYDKLLYFGIKADEHGLITDEDGYKNLEKFTQDSGSKKKLLTIRMLNTDTNLEILNSVSSQKKIIDQATILAKKYNFLGLVLDFETQGLPFESLVTKITKLHALFAKETHNQGLSFGTLLYGDTFYRVRPYDAASISKFVDRVYVMAYDFSKAKSDPGPNFPLSGADEYGYDFKTMVSDFSKEVSREKLTIIFGMFGYDWKIDEKGRGKETAVSGTTLQFEKKLTTCISDDSCKSSIDRNAQETKITYKENLENHIIWFEDNNSKEKKIIYLHSQHLNSVGDWAYGYF